MKKIFKNIWHYYENKSSSFFRINEMDALIKNLDEKNIKILSILVLEMVF